MGPSPPHAAQIPKEGVLSPNILTGGGEWGLCGRWLIPEDGSELDGVWNNVWK